MILRLHGGLGNQLFQLLAARYLAKQSGEEINIYINDLDKFSTKRDFEIKPLLRKEEKTIDSIRPLDTALFKYKISKVLSTIGIHSVSNVANFSAWKGQYLNGYFQDIYNYRKKDIVLEIVQEIEQSLFSLPCNSCLKQTFDSSTAAIHFRLTDFLQHPQGEYFLKTYRVPYILRAIKYFEKEHGIKNLVVFTDDLTLAKKLLNYGRVTFFDDVKPVDASLLQEFCFLSSFKYLITSNSTFSFWSSIIGSNKRIVFPALWKHDDKKEDTIFKRNIELHTQLFPLNNYIKVI